ncbi:MAG: response regulator [Pseudobdellovibrionaceae bacterium]|uniref:response regulator n=1 Tax=Oligoflexus sp. TaxID=1971216 RepID=UPI0027C3FC5E|nr:response regulator [Oligoflexus sp.]MDQ3231830.1 response regulator [Pseudobdellovibrionaceae bacterium]HYX31576.1 response regulator [Oligoflexus sp.]
MFARDTKILIVDDMNMFRQMVRQALNTLEFKKMTEASDGTHAFAALAEAAQTQEPYQMVISDWNMPKMKGIELLKKVRAEEWGKKLPFIMLTAEAEKDHIIEAVQAGVDNYIIKPFTVDQMKQRLTQTYDKLYKPKPKAKAS